MWYQFVENNNNNVARWSMESFDDLLTMLERPAAKRRPVKRKWREIEAVKERQRLRKELEDIDFSFDDDLIDQLMWQLKALPYSVGFLVFSMQQLAP